MSLPADFINPGFVTRDDLHREQSSKLEGARHGGKGQPKTGGRQVGTPNKHGTALKEMVFGALQAKDGQAWLEQQMDKNPVAFMALLGKFVPTTLAGDSEAPVVHKIERVIVCANSENPNG